MDELTQKDIEIYTKFPHKIRAILAEKSDIFFWIKSDYGMGYKLVVPTNNHHTIAHTVEKNIGHWEVTATAQDLSGYAVPSTTTNMIYNHQVHGTAFPSSMNKSNKTLTLLPKVLSFWKIPHFADDIIEAIEKLVFRFFNGNTVYNTPNNFNGNTVYTPNNHKVKSPELFSFEIDFDNRNAVIKLQDEELNVEGGKDLPWRTLALMMLEKVYQTLMNDYKPSLTEIKNVKNVTLDNSQERSITFNYYYEASRLFHEYPYCLFASEDDLTLNKHKAKCKGKIQLVEGEFNVYYEQFPESLTGTSDLYGATYSSLNF